MRALVFYEVPALLRQSPHSRASVHSYHQVQPYEVFAGLRRPFSFGRAVVGLP
jgi:hypothetical protein